jgi:hypothetical protein
MKTRPSVGTRFYVVAQDRWRERVYVVSTQTSRKLRRSTECQQAINQSRRKVFQMKSSVCKFALLNRGSSDAIPNLKHVDTEWLLEEHFTGCFDASWNIYYGPFGWVPWTCGMVIR